MQQLKVFVSSTCFDLSQVRSDLYDFFTGIGHLPSLSEYSSFTIDPDSNTLDNCIQNVKNSDLFILIIGNRYGYVMDSGKSITNTEYLYAKETGIPTYIFITKALSNILPVWKKNKDADFSGIVDSTKVFEFLEEVMEINKDWCFQFEKAQDITNTLRIQLSHLFRSSLDVRRKFKISAQPDFYQHLSARALNILLKKDLLYEALFFAQVLKDELLKYEDVKLDLDYNILSSCSREIQDKQLLISWMNINIETITNQIASFNNLFNVFAKYYGLPGEPANLKGLFYVAKALAKVYKEMALWSLDIKSTRVDEKYEPIRDTVSRFPLKALERIWDYPDQTFSEIEDGVRLYMQDKNQKVKVQSILVLEVDEKCVREFKSELERIRRY